MLLYIPMPINTAHFRIISFKYIFFREKYMNQLFKIFPSSFLKS